LSEKWELIEDRALKRKRFLAEWREHVERLAQEARRLLGDARVLAFGSVVRGDWCVESDVDVLIVSPRVPSDAVEGVKLKVRLRELLGACIPLELHLAAPEEFEHWYKRFIDVYEEF
jgi:predicted nucleotidyltransferase